MAPTAGTVLYGLWAALPTIVGAAIIAVVTLLFFFMCVSGVCPITWGSADE
ncbi:hypothetical protein [Lysinibacter sp. HNR]|uniref:hypothetical protein n=1 Tax=Lysinibacter sp. HNR TaxID=3031408 RepID=UPI0024351611|nr:hypothetical protein [Lysinibacter sp. HNR]WGD38171.1 hypothetical protein FrondiHNR_04445 [Lysinibacter sp. HNR]